MLSDIGKRFSSAAAYYDQHAQTQANIAAQFADWLQQTITEAVNPSQLVSYSSYQPKRIVEIGCGTGFLSRRLRQHYPHTQLHMTDIAPGMVSYCRQQWPVEDQLVTYEECDGQQALFLPRPDWIVSSMCFQWFDNLETVIEHHIKQCKVLAFAILLDGSFQAWIDAHHVRGLKHDLRLLPRFDHLHRFLQQQSMGHINSHQLQLEETHANGLDFARHLRDIGANTPYTQQHVNAWKPLLRQLDSPFSVSYKVGFFICRNI